ncbi:MAG TPA: nitroreductase family protein [bacterium]|nr:nitroreductase family protein [bacterium]
MGFLQIVKERYSVRRYLHRPGAREVLERCCEAARLAASACNQQPWYFIAVENPVLRQRLGEAAFSGIYAMNRFALTAPVLIVVVSRRTVNLPGFAGRLRKTPYNLMDVAIACEHLILQAAEEGLGSCWLGWFDERAVKKILRLSPLDHIPALISLGYPEKKDRPPLRRKSLEEIRTYR